MNPNHSSSAGGEYAGEEWRMMETDFNLKNLKGYIIRMKPKETHKLADWQKWRKEEKKEERREGEKEGRNEKGKMEGWEKEKKIQWINFCFVDRLNPWIPTAHLSKLHYW